MRPVGPSPPTSPRPSTTYTKRQVRVENATNRKFTEMALNSLITALKDPDDYVVERALLGLGLLAHEDTPIVDISMIVEDTKRSLDLRRNGSWALSVMRDQLTPDKSRIIRPIFQRLLLQPLGEVEPPIVCHSLHTPRALPQCAGCENHRAVHQASDSTRPNPRCDRARTDPEREVRSCPARVDKDAEDNQNVRLAAHKSLKALAGGRIVATT